MVRYGSCTIKCAKCGSGCEVKTEIQRNKEWDNSIVMQECKHGKMSIDMFTRNTFTPWGNPDEIKFKVHFIFLDGDNKGKTFTREFSRISTGVGDEEASEDCALAEAHFSSNGFADYLKNTMAIGVASAFIGEHYETRKFH